MYLDISQSDQTISADPEITDLSIPRQRAFGAARVSFKSDGKSDDKSEGKSSGKSSGNITNLDRLYQTGCAKIRLPKTYGAYKEAVMINTSGGITGGDRLDWQVSVGEGAHAVVTTQASERAYKATTGAADVKVNIDVGAGASCHWLPQETILFDQSAMGRKMHVDMADDGQLMLLETIMLGRAAMGEVVETCYFKDSWRVKKGGKLIFADDVKLDGDIKEITQSRGLLGSNLCFATLLFVSGQDQERDNKLVQEARKLVPSAHAALSAFDGKIVARFIATDTYDMRKFLIPVLDYFRADDLPQVWRL